MSLAQHQRLKEVHAAAGELHGTERQRYLQEISLLEPRLAHEVAELLAWEEAHPDFLEPAPVAPAEISPGTRLGPWRIERELGRGGMGIVYLVERADGEFHKQAALKLLGPVGFHTDAQLERRFRREREILARFEHPHIARLLDGGTAPDGRPFLVMEYLTGLPLLAFCHAQALPLTARIRLLAKIARAVQYAHQRLVIHRDLKPGNILITPDGEPHLLDFGIAGLLREDGAARVATGATVTAAHAFTPAYASPEQLADRPMLTTASDVFALGVLAHECLSERHPFRAEGESVSAAMLARRIDDPLAEHRPSAAGGRWAKDLRGDLDAIVLKALRHAPGERYASAEELAEDLDRHLQGLPVRARREDGWSYRAAKFTRRHRLGLGLAATLLATIAASAVALLRQARETRAQRDLALETAALMAGELGEGLERMAGPAEVRLRLVQRAAQTLERIDRAGLGGPEVERQRVEANLRLCSAYRYLGDHDAALAQARQGVTRARALAARDPAEELLLVRTLDVLGHVFAQAAQRGEAVAVRTEAVGLLERAGAPALDPSRRELRELYAHLAPELGEALASTDRDEEAVRVYQAALAACDAWRKDDPGRLPYLQGLATSAGGLSLLASKRGDASVRWREQSRCVESWRLVLERAPGVPEVLLNLAQETSQLALAGFETGRPGEGLAHQQETVRILRELFERDRSSLLVRGMLLSHLERCGAFLRREGQREASRAALEESLRLVAEFEPKLAPPMIAALGSAEVELGLQSSNPGLVTRGTERLRALAARLPHERQLRARWLLAEAALAAPSADALSVLDRAMATVPRVQRLPVEASALLVAQVRRGELLLALGRPAEAEAARTEARALLREIRQARRWPPVPAGGMPEPADLAAALE